MCEYCQPRWYSDTAGAAKCSECGQGKSTLSSVPRAVCEYCQPCDVAFEMGECQPSLRYEYCQQCPPLSEPKAGQRYCVCVVN